MASTSDFPEMKVPPVLKEEDCKSVIKTYQHWLFKRLDETGGQELVKKFKIASYLVEQFKAKSTSEKAAAHLFNSPEWLQLNSLIQHLFDQLGLDFPPMSSLMADFLIVKAEAADISLQSLRNTENPDGIDPDEAKKMLTSIVGMSSLQEVIECYNSSAALSYNAIAGVMSIVREADTNDLQRSMMAAWNQWATSHLIALNRSLLVELSLHLDQFGTAASVGEVLPLLVNKPEAYEAVVTPERVENGLMVVNYFHDETFNDNGSVMVFFNAVGILAMIMRRYDEAQQAFHVALGVSDPSNVPEVLSGNMMLLESLRQNN